MGDGFVVGASRYRSSETGLAEVRRRLEPLRELQALHKQASAQLDGLRGLERRAAEENCERLSQRLQALRALEAAYVEAFDRAVASLMHDPRVRRWRAELDRTRTAGRDVRAQISRLRDVRVPLAELVALLAEARWRPRAARVRTCLARATRAAAGIDDSGVRIHVQRAASMVRLMLPGSSVARSAAVRQLHRATARVALCEERRGAEHDELRARHDYAQAQLIAFVEGE